MDLDDIKRGLRAEIKKRENESYLTFQCNVRQMCKDVLAKLEEQESEIAELKQKLEDAKATAYTESVDAGMENRRLKRALWLARAYRGRDNSILLPSKFMRNVWDNVERKCRAMAERYGEGK